MSEKEPLIWTPFFKSGISIYGFSFLFGKAKIDERKKNKIRNIMEKAIRTGDKSMAWVARDLAYLVKEQSPEFLDEMHEAMEKIRRNA